MSILVQRFRTNAFAALVLVASLAASPWAQALATPAIPTANPVVTPAAAPKNTRPLVAVSELQRQGIEESEAAIISDRLRSELSATGAYRVMERSQMEAILREQGFQQSGACSGGDCQVEVGRLLGVQQLLVGQVGKIGSLYTMSVRMIDVQSAEVVLTQTKDHDGGIESLLTKGVPSVAKAIADKQRAVERAAAAPAEAAAKAQAAADEAAAKVIAGSPDSKSAKAWKPWVAGGLALLGAGLVAGGFVEDGVVKDRHAEYKALTGANSSSTEFKTSWDRVNDAQNLRNVLYGAGGVFLAAGLSVQLLF